MDDENLKIRHFVSANCTGEMCGCGNFASHKIGEEIPSDHPMNKVVKGPGGISRDPMAMPRHNLTAYVCCRCFVRLMGPVAQKMCSGGGK